MDDTLRVAVKESMVNTFLGDSTPPVPAYTENTRNVMNVKETVNVAKLVALIRDDFRIDRDSCLCRNKHLQKIEITAPTFKHFLTV